MIKSENETWKKLPLIATEKSEILKNHYSFLYHSAIVQTR